MSIWDSTSEYMLQQFALKKGVAVDVLGTFYILRKRICEGTRPMIVPRFYLSQRVAQAQGLIYTNSDIPDDLKVVPLDYSQLSLKTSLPEKLVKECVNDIVVLFSWGAGLGEDYDLVFKGIGVLMSRNRILTMRYREEFLLAVDQTGAALKCLLANPQTEVCVLSGREPAAFHVCPGGIRVLPGFKIKLPSEIKAGELSPDKEADEKEGARSYQDKYLHQQKTQPPHHQKGDRAIEGNQKHRRTPMDNGIFSQLLAGLKSRSDAEEGGVREDVYKEQEKEGSRKHPTAQRRLPPLTLLALPTKALRGEPAPSTPRPKRTEFSHAPSGTQGSAKLLRKLRGEEGQAEEGEGDGRAAGSRKHAQRRLPPVTVLELPADVTQAQPALGAPRPKSALPAIEGSSSKAGKRRKVRQCREKTEIPACKDHQRVGQEVCYLCLQQEQHRLRAAMLEEKEKKERAERAELQDWKTRMAALSQRRARAAWEREVAKTDKKENLRCSRNYLESLCPTPPGYIRRMEYDRELQERREVWEKERWRVPAKIPLRQ
ncbi:coiled-coil domain-containing protein 81-like [Tympanuchus pallidicinctus]|uniref:coiled-coil domain-containing protein 81-like n=1 Tax=Tympanuchus pallidicinctus TaxID=109042 RepID=UPI002286D309|nr:coiled-coil domain-containing protein 81-like [Tympanuchus pallidicinctus]